MILLTNQLCPRLYVTSMKRQVLKVNPTLKKGEIIKCFSVSSKISYVLVQISERSVSRILKPEQFHPYRIQLLQELVKYYFHRGIEFRKIMRQRCVTGINFPLKIVFYDEAFFFFFYFVWQCDIWFLKILNE